MRYFVVTSSGRFGPADLPTQAQWAREGRLGPTSVLEEESSGRRIEAKSLPGLAFNTFVQAPVAGNTVAPKPPGPQPPSQAPPPPPMVSNYRRPDWEPPLFLAHEVDGRRESHYAFALAVAAPIVSIFAIYGLAMPLGGVFCAWLAIKRGRRLGYAGIVANAIALPAAIFLYFRPWMFF